MQNPDNGQMVPIPAGLGDMITKLATAANCEVPIFHIGEEIALRGGRFRVAAIGKRFIRLEGLPGTHVEEGKP